MVVIYFRVLLWYFSQRTEEKIEDQHASINLVVQEKREVEFE
jgi:hypothetical protein